MDLNRGLRVLEGRARVLKLLLITYIALTAFTASSLSSAMLMGIDLEDFEHPLILSSALAIFLVIALFIACIVTFCLWSYRAHANLVAAGFEDLEFTPAASVYWYFVPVALLFTPYRAMRELWNTSHRARVEDTGSADIRVKIWWGLWLVGGAITRLSNSSDFLGPSDLIGFSLLAGAALILLIIVREITRAQTETLSASQVFA